MTRRRILPWALLALSFVTLSFAGGAFWVGTVQEIRNVGDLLTLWRSGAGYAALVILILGAHELGHYFACRRYRIPCTPPFFIPGPPPLGSFGALIRIRGQIPDRRALFDVAAAGPIAGFVVAVPVLVWGLLSAEPFVPAPELEGMGIRLGEPLLMLWLNDWINPGRSITVNAGIGAGWVGMLVTSLNLFPVGQLDGGHAAYALSRRLHRALSRITLVVMASAMVIQLVVMQTFPFYVVWFGILLWMRDRHPPVFDEWRPPGGIRPVVAVVLLALWILSFIPVPIDILD